VVEILLNKSDH